MDGLGARNKESKVYYYYWIKTTADVDAGYQEPIYGGLWARAKAVKGV